MNRLSAVILGFILVFLMAVNVSAQSPNAGIPERNGDYPDPTHPGIRVRVFVHEPPRARPGSEVLAVCTDNPSEAVVGATNWKLPNTNWKYKINSSSVPSSVGQNNLAGIASDSFNTWTNSISSSSSKPNLVFDGQTSKTRNGLDFENIITWGRTSGSALGVTYVWYYTATNLVADVDTIMNKKFPWSLGTCSANSYDAENILIHELGHWFGLDDEYTAGYTENTMYGYGSKAELKKITPTNGDKAGINLIYP